MYIILIPQIIILILESFTVGVSLALLISFLTSILFVIRIIGVQIDLKYLAIGQMSAIGSHLLWNIIFDAKLSFKMYIIFISLCLINLIIMWYDNEFIIYFKGEE